MFSKRNEINEPTKNNLPNDMIDWNEISEFIIDMLDPKYRGNKGWKVINDTSATSILKENSVIVLEILLFCAVPLSLKQRKQLRHSTLKNCGCHYRTRSLQSVIFIYSHVQIYLYTFYQTMCKICYPLYVIFL